MLKSNMGKIGAVVIMTVMVLGELQSGQNDYATTYSLNRMWLTVFKQDMQTRSCSVVSRRYFRLGNIFG